MRDPVRTCSEAQGKVRSVVYVNTAHAIASRTVVTASKIVLPETSQSWLGCKMSETVGLSGFVLIRARILYSVSIQAIGLHSAGVVGMSVLGMHNTMPCFCCYMIRTFKYIWLNRASMSSFMLYQLTLSHWACMIKVACVITTITHHRLSILWHLHSVAVIIRTADISQLLWLYSTCPPVE